MDVYLDGFTCHALKTGVPFKVENLYLRGKRLTLERTAEGNLLLNAKPMTERKITWDKLNKD